MHRGSKRFCKSHLSAIGAGRRIRPSAEPSRQSRRAVSRAQPSVESGRLGVTVSHESLAQPSSDVGELRVVHTRCGVSERQVRFTIDGYDVEVAVRYLQSGDDERYPCWLEHFHLSPADLLGHEVDARPQVRRYIEPMVDLADWQYEAMAWLDRTDRHDRRHVLVSPYEMTGDLSGEDE